MHHRQLFRYFAVFAGITIATIAIIFGWLISRDPYDLYGLLYESDATVRVGSPPRQAKSVAIIGRRPDALLLGASRTHVGYGTTHEFWRPYRGYNLGLDAASIYEMRRFFDHAAALQRIRLLVLTLDLESFRNDEREWGDFNESHFIVGVSGRPAYGWILAVMATTFSLDAIERALDPQASRAVLYDSQGRSLLPELRKPSSVEAFRHVFSGTIKYFAPRLHPGRYSGNTEAAWPPMQDFRALLSRACTEGATVYMVVNPVHISLRHLMHTVDSEKIRDHWRMALFREYEGQKAGGCAMAGFWDFSVYEPYTEEPLPILGNVSGLPLYWIEPAHFTYALGERIQDEIFDAKLEGSATHRLKNRHEMRIRIDSDQRILRQWQGQHPAEAKLISDLVDASARQ